MILQVVVYFMVATRQERAMEPIILDQILCTITAEEVAPKLHIEQGTEDYEALAGLVAKACRIARPKAVYTTSYITGRGSDFMLLDAVRMDSRVMPVNLAKVHRVFPYVATCGTEVDEWSEGITDMLYHWWTDTIKIHVLHKAIAALNTRLKDGLRLGTLSNMNPRLPARLAYYRAAQAVLSVGRRESQDRRNTD